jgi:hypothetical protein
MRSSEMMPKKESDDEQAASAERLRRRNRLLVGVGLLCFIVGVPLVSLPDGTALSVIGLSLETVAGACVISFIYLLAGDQHEPDGEEDELVGGESGHGGEDQPDSDEDELIGGEDEPGGDEHEPQADSDERDEEH